MRRSASLLAAAAALAAGAPGPALAQSQDLRITHSSEDSRTQRLTLGVGKAAIVDLPVEARDVLVSNPAVADAVVRSARRVYVIGRQMGAANAFFFDSQGRKIADLEIEVQPDLAGLNRLLATAAPNGKVRAIAVNQTVALTGSVASAAEADRVTRIATAFISGGQSGGAASGGEGGESSGAASASSASGQGAPQLVNLLAIEGDDQVLVKVRIVEMSRELRRQLGIRINDTGDLLTNVLPNDFALNFANNPFIAGGPAGSAFARAVLSGDTGPDLDATLEAFELAGLARVLAEPNLTAVSGEAAQFLSGGEFPTLREITEEGNLRFELRPFGVGLAVTPVVLSSGRISLKLSTEVSERRDTDDGTGLDELEVRRAETTVEMSSGSSLVIAGLIEDNATEQVSGAPGLMRIPGLGALFRSTVSENEQRELVIIVTPYTVRPAEPGALRTPLDGVRSAGWSSLTFTDRLNAIYHTPASQPAARPLEGPIGFVLPDTLATPGSPAP